VVDDLLLVLLVDEMMAALVACPSPPWSVPGLPALLLLGQVLARLPFSSLVRCLSFRLPSPRLALWGFLVVVR
jgi:hypothetical protein